MKTGTDAQSLTQSGYHQVECHRYWLHNIRENTSLSNNQTKVENKLICKFTKYSLPFYLSHSPENLKAGQGLNSMQNKIMQFSTDLFKLCKVFVEFGNEMHQLSPFKKSRPHNKASRVLLQRIWNWRLKNLTRNKTFSLNCLMPSDLGACLVLTG